jgi:hypothetical protein
MPELNENFWRWFGDSKVVDAEGQPLVVYHGGRLNLKSFRPIAYFTDYEEEALEYAGSGGTVVSAYLRIVKPYNMDAYDQGRLTDSTVKRLMKRGYDGIIGEGTYHNLHFVAFHPEQIKSATGNDGTWDADDPDIASNPWIDDDEPVEGEYRIGELHWNSPAPPKSKGLVLRDGSYVWWVTKAGPDGAEPHHGGVQEDLTVAGYHLNEYKYPDDPQNVVALLTSGSRVLYITLLETDPPLCAARALLRCFRGLKMNSELIVSTDREDGEFDGTVSDFARECEYLKSQGVG